MTAPNQEQRNAEEIVRLREYFLQRVDALQLLIGQGVTREELSRELARVYKEIADSNAEVVARIDDVREDIKTVITRSDDLEQSINDKQDQGQKRIIATQASILFIILSTLATIAATQLFHH